MTSDEAGPNGIPGGPPAPAPRIDGVSVGDRRFFVFLSNHTTFSVDFSVSPVLEGLTRLERLDWQLSPDRQSISWNQPTFYESLDLPRLLNDPSVRIGDFPPGS
jgi:hypothetical protein